MHAYVYSMKKTHTSTNARTEKNNKNTHTYKAPAVFNTLLGL